MTSIAMTPFDAHAAQVQPYRLVLLDRTGGVRLGETVRFADRPQELGLLHHAGRDCRILDVDGDEILLEPAAPR